MSSAENIDDDCIDQVIHSDDMSMNVFLEMFQIRVLEVNLLKSLLKKFSMDAVREYISMLFLFFE